MAAEIGPDISDIVISSTPSNISKIFSNALYLSSISEDMQTFSIHNVMITRGICSATNVSTNEFQIDIMKYFCFIYPIIIILVLKSLHPTKAGPSFSWLLPSFFASQHISRSIRNLFLWRALIDHRDRARC